MFPLLLFRGSFRFSLHRGGRLFALVSTLIYFALY